MRREVRRSECSERVLSAAPHPPSGSRTSCRSANAACANLHRTSAPARSARPNGPGAPRPPPEDPASLRTRRSATDCSSISRFDAQPRSQRCQLFQAPPQALRAVRAKARTHNALERPLQLQAHVTIQRQRLPSVGCQRHQFTPLLSRLQHVCQQRLAVGHVAIAMQQYRAQRRMQRRVAAAKLQQRSSCRQPIKRLRIFHRLPRPARSREQRQRIRNLRAYRIDRANIQPARPLQQAPAKPSRCARAPPSPAPGSRVRSSKPASRPPFLRTLQLLQHTFAQLRRRFVRERDCKHFLGLFDRLFPAA